MPWAAGSYSKGNNGTGGWVGDASLGIGIEASRHDTQDNDFALGINQCINKDGSNVFTGNPNINNNRITNVGAATARTDAPQVAQVQDGDFIWLGTTGGTATAQTATASPAITAYKAGQKFRMKIGAGLGSTQNVQTAHTLNVNSVGAKNIVNNEDGTNPTLGTWVAGAIMEVIYDGTNFVITNDPGGWLSYTPTFTPNGGSVTSLNILRAKYRKIQKSVLIQVYAIYNTTSVGVNINVSVPINFNITAGNFYQISMNYSGALVAGYINNNSASVFGCYRDLAGGTWGTNTSSAVYINAHYEAV